MGKYTDDQLKAIFELLKDMPVEDVIKFINSL